MTKSELVADLLAERFAVPVRSWDDAHASGPSAQFDRLTRLRELWALAEVEPEQDVA